MDTKKQMKSLNELKEDAERKAAKAAIDKELADIARARLKDLLETDSIKLTFQKELISSLTKIIELAQRTESFADKAQKAYEYALNNFGVVDVSL